MAAIKELFLYLILLVAFLFIGLILRIVVKQGIADYHFKQSLKNPQDFSMNRFHLEKAIRLQPRNPNYYNQMGLHYLSKAKSSQGDEATNNFRLARRDFATACKLAPANPFLHINLAYSGYQDTQNPDQFYKELLAIEQLDPYNKYIQRTKIWLHKYRATKYN